MVTRHPGPTAPLARCLAVWLLATTAAVGTGSVLSGSLSPDALRAATAPGVPFDALLVTACTALLAACVTWAWLATTAAVLEAATGLRLPRTCPAAVRRVVLAACGLALVTVPAPALAATGNDDGVGASARSAAGDPAILAGLPLPDRSESPQPPPVLPRPVLTAHRPAGEVVVRPGDSLWSIAARTLPDGATEAEIGARWRLLWEVNRDAVGPDPDLIVPGTSLRLPPLSEEDAR